MRIWILVVASLLAGAAATADEFSVLSYNTHGLSAWIAGDDPETRFPIIAEKSGAYDVALIQEDFAHHAALRANARQGLIERGNDSRFGNWCPLCSGSGLTILSRFERDDVLELMSRRYAHCAGWLGGANDCLASKGFQRMRLRLASGGTLDFVNTHLDAGRAETDRDARREQLALLERSLARDVGDRALIVAGDLNLSAADPADVALRDAFAEALGLIDSGARARAGSDWPILDYIFYRSGDGVTLELLDAGEDVSFVHEGVALSDHPAIFARFRTRYRVVEMPPSTGMMAPVR